MNAVLVDRLKAYVTPGATTVSAIDDAFIEQCLAEAIALVNRLCGGGEHAAIVARVPYDVLERAYIEVGSELYNRRSAPNGISQFAAADGSAIRVARDPLVAARPLLQPYLPLGFS